jgi:hypothetical protein
MRTSMRQFVGGAFVLIGLFLILAHAGGFSQALGSGTTGAANIFKTLQGR